MTQRFSRIERTTSETEIALTLKLDGRGSARVATGIGFLDHLLTSIARFSGFDLELSCRGDLEVDDHHTAEDCALALGQALDQALGERSGIARFGWALAPMDESLARAAVDLSGRPFSVIELGLARERIGEIASENVTHFMQSFATAARMCLHLEVLRGANDHHRAEAAAKALGLALGQAVSPGREPGAVPSTKGVL